MAINSLSTANTFQEWLVTTSTLVAVTNNLTDGSNGYPLLINSQLILQGSNASINVRNSGAINQLYANTANISNVSFATSNIYLPANGSLIGGNIQMANVTSNLTVGGDAFISGNLVVSGNVTLDALGFDEISIAGGAYIGTVLNVSQGSTFTGDIIALSNVKTVNVTSNLYVGANATVYGNISISGNTTSPNVNTGNLTANTLVLTGSLRGAVNTAIYNSITAAIDASIGFAMALS